MNAFDPWIGDKYRSEGLNGLRVLILGESQYGDDPTYSTGQMIQELGIDARRSFFTKLVKLLIDSPADNWVSDEVRKNFFHRIAFYNYIQSWLPAPRHRPTEAMWIAAAQPFRSTVSSLQPHVIVVLGSELATWVPDIEPTIAIAKIHHPSSKGFTYSTWTPVVQHALQTARTSPSRGN